MNPFKVKTGIGLGMVMVLLTGCIRLAGGAGYSVQKAGEEAPETRSVGFDTQRLVPGSTADSAQIEIPGS